MCDLMCDLKCALLARVGVVDKLDGLDNGRRVVRVPLLELKVVARGGVGAAECKVSYGQRVCSIYDLLCPPARLIYAQLRIMCGTAGCIKAWQKNTHKFLLSLLCIPLPSPVFNVDLNNVKRGVEGWKREQRGWPLISVLAGTRKMPAECSNAKGQKNVARMCVCVEGGQMHSQ